MLTPVNYVDLFDRLYPEQHLHGLTDDNQITVEELNRRYATIRANQRTMSMAMNAIYADQPEGAHLRDYMLPFWEIAYSRKYVISRKDVATLRYVRGYDPAGLDLQFPEPRTALYANDCGSELLERDVELLLFSDGLLVPPADYHVHPSQGGFAVYLKESRVVVGATVRIVVFRKFNQRGQSFERIPAAAIAIADPALPDGTPAAHVAFDLKALGYVHDIRFYALFARKAGDQYFRPVPEDFWSARAMPGYDTAIAGVLGGYAVPGDYEFVLVDKAEFWKHELHADVAPRDSVWKVDLVDSRGMPLPVAHEGDVDVWVRGRKLRAGVDYWVEFGNPEFPDIPPRIMFEDVHYGDGLHLMVMSGAPRDREASIEMDADMLPNHDAVVRLDPRLRRIRLLQNVGLVFSSGYLELAGDGIETIADNLALHFDGLRDADEFTYRARFVFAPETIDGAFRQTEVPTVLERFARTVGSLRPDGFYDEQWFSGDFRTSKDGEFVHDGQMDFRDGAYNLRRGASDFRDRDRRSWIDSQMDFREREAGRWYDSQTIDGREGQYYGDVPTLRGGECPGKSPCDTAQWDLVAIHRRNHPTPPVKRGILPDRGRRQFPALYFYLRDEYREVSPISVGGPMEPLFAWKQGPKVNLDCRQKGHGPEDCIQIDFRGDSTALPAEFPGYTGGFFTEALATQGDFRPGGLDSTEALAKWTRDIHGNTVLDGRELTFWMSTAYGVYDFRDDKLETPDTFVSYVSGAFTAAVGPLTDFRDGRMMAPSGWAMDLAGNTVYDARELAHWRAPGNDVADFRGVTVDVQDPYVSYVTGAFVSTLSGFSDFRDGTVFDAGRWVTDESGNTALDGRELTHWRASTGSVYDFRGQSVEVLDPYVSYLSGAFTAAVGSPDFRDGAAVAPSGWAMDESGNTVYDARDLVHWRTTSSDVADFRGVTVDVQDPYVSYVSGAFTSALGPTPDFRDGRGLAPAGWSMDAVGNTVFDARELFHWRATADDVVDFRGQTVPVADPYVSYVSGAFVSALGGFSDFRDGRGLAPTGWNMDAAGNTVLDGRELTYWRATADDVYDFRGQTVPVADPYVSYVSGAFTSALGGFSDFRDGAEFDVPQWAVDQNGDTVLDGRELTYWRATQGSIYDFRGETVDVPLTEVAVKPTAAFVDALAPTVDARSTDVPASLGAYAVNSVGDIVVDGRDLIYFGSTTSVPLEGRETASP